MITCNSGGTGPGCILLLEEYTLGICLSLWHREHSALPDDWSYLVNPGNVSPQVEHVFTCNSANLE